MKSKHGLLQFLPNINEKQGWLWTEESDILDNDILESYPKITIITPSFNQGAYIEETIRSILLQNYPNLEYIIIDGGSTDNTVEIIKKYEKWITYWVSEKDSGQSAAINKGLRKATGKFFTWINSDDFLEKNALIKLFSASENIARYDIITGNCWVFSNSDYHKKQKIKLKYNANDIEDTIINQSMCQPSTFFSVEWAKQSGYINESLHYTMDLELWFRYLIETEKHKVKYIDIDVAYFREHSDSKTISVPDKFIQEEDIIYKHIAQMFFNPDELLFSYIKPKNVTNIIIRKNKAAKLNKAIISKLFYQKYFTTHISSQYYKSNSVALLKAFILLLSHKATVINLLILKLVIKLLIPQSLFSFFKKLKNKMLSI